MTQPKQWVIKSKCEGRTSSVGNRLVLLRSSKPTAGRHPFVDFSLLSKSMAPAPFVPPSAAASGKCRDVDRAVADRHQNRANHGDVVGGGLISHAWSQASLKGQHHQNNSDQSLHRQRLIVRNFDVQIVDLSRFLDRLSVTVLLAGLATLLCPCNLWRCGTLERTAHTQRPDLGEHLKKTATSLQPGWNLSECRVMVRKRMVASRKRGFWNQSLLWELRASSRDWYRSISRDASVSDRRRLAFGLRSSSVAVFVHHSYPERSVSSWFLKLILERLTWTGNHVQIANMFVSSHIPKRASLSLAMLPDSCLS